MRGGCLGCRTYFQKLDHVEVESLTIEFKNYRFPIQSSKLKFILLKTVTSFLNSKGGTIYIGIEDTQGEVIGVQASRKQQDEFMLGMKQLMEKITPPVDLINKEEITIKFVPVVVNKVFDNKYVCKVIVKQGDPSQTYRIAQKIQLQSGNGKTEDYQIYQAYYRHNMAGGFKISGQGLLQEIYRKAIHPNQIANTFHKFCNPEPLKLQMPPCKIGFQGVKSEQLRTKLEVILANIMLRFEINYEITYDIENQAVLLEVESNAQLLEINNYFKQQLQEFNETNMLFNFVDKGLYLDFYLYRNLSRYLLKETKSCQKQSKEQQPQVMVAESSKQELIMSQVQKVPGEYKVPIKSSQTPKTNELQFDDEEQSRAMDKLQNNSQRSLYQQLKEDKFPHLSLIATHFKKENRDDLVTYLKQSIKAVKIMYKQHRYTIQLLFQNRNDLLGYYDALQKNHLGPLSQFGIKGNLIMGLPTPYIRIRNYDRYKRTELLRSVKALLGDDAKEIGYKKWNNKYFLECKMKSLQFSYEWLDRLIESTEIKRFERPGAAQSSNTCMSIYIDCICD